MTEPSTRRDQLGRRDARRPGVDRIVSARGAGASLDAFARAADTVSGKIADADVRAVRVARVVGGLPVFGAVASLGERPVGRARRVRRGQRRRCGQRPVEGRRRRDGSRLTLPAAAIPLRTERRRQAVAAMRRGRRPRRLHDPDRGENTGLRRRDHLEHQKRRDQDRGQDERMKGEGEADRQISLEGPPPIGAGNGKDQIAERVRLIHGAPLEAGPDARPRAAGAGKPGTGSPSLIRAGPSS